MLCACGCGQVVSRRFKRGHSSRGRKLSQVHKDSLRVAATGHTLSAASRLKISAGKKGQHLPPQSEETKRKRALTQTGSGNGMWRGGISTSYAYSGLTRALKEAIRKRDHYECQRCGEPNISQCLRTGYSLPIHHINHVKNDHRPSNLLTTCQACNIWFSFHHEVSMMYSKEDIA